MSKLIPTRILIRSFCSKAFKQKHTAESSSQIAPTPTPSIDALGSLMLNEIRELPDDLKPGFLNSGRKKSRLGQISINEEGEDIGVPVSQFRHVIYNEGELDHSDFSQPPSLTNPHPFDPSTLPPTHSTSLTAYVNHLPVLQKLVDIGVNLFQVDLEHKIGRKLIQLDWDKDVQPKLQWLVQHLDVDPEDLGDYLTRNPFFLLQIPEKLQERVDYLRAKQFNSDQIKRCVILYRYWLNNDIKVIDNRLGWLQNQFKLKGSDLRKLVTKEPRIIAFGVGPLTRITSLMNQDFQMDPGMIKHILFNDPRVFMIDVSLLTKSHLYLTQVLGITKEQIAEFPLSLRCPTSMLRRRFEFLKRINKAQFNPELPDYIPLKKLLHSSDLFFSEKVCEVKLEDYQKFLKTI